MKKAGASVASGAIVNANTYAVAVAGMGNYADSATTTFTVSRAAGETAGVYAITPSGAVG